MAKSSSKVAKVAKPTALDTPKKAGVQKAVKGAEKVKSAAKAAVKEKKSKKAKSPTPSSSSSESSSESGSDSSDSESEEETVTKKVVDAGKAVAEKAGKVVKAVKEAVEESDSSSESGSDSESEEEAKKDDSESGSDSDDSSSDEEMNDAKKEESGSDSDSDSDSEESEAGDKKRKAETAAEPEAKRSKTEESSDSEESKTIFVGRLSWNVDNEWLGQEFADAGEVVEARVVMDRQTNRSKGFGYVEFSTAAAAKKAVAELQGKEIDGRPVNLDISQPKPKQENRGDRAERYGDKVSPPSDTLFVGNISFDATEDELYSVFGECGNVLNVRLPTDRETGNLKGFGYVQFGTIEDAQKAHAEKNGAEIAGRSIRVDFSQPRDDSAPRGGGRGGFGGGDRGGRGGRGGGRGGFGGGRGGGRGGFGGDRGGRGGRGGGRGGFQSNSSNRGGVGEARGTKISF